MLPVYLVWPLIFCGNWEHILKIVLIMGIVGKLTRVDL